MGNSTIDGRRAGWMMVVLGVVAAASLIGCDPEPSSDQPGGQGPETPEALLARIRKAARGQRLLWWENLPNLAGDAP
jgi:hypothetical protein